MLYDENFTLILIFDTDLTKSRTRKKDKKIEIQLNLYF